MLSYEDERSQTVPHFDGADSQYSPSDSATYATLTPLRPPSPLHVFSDKSGVSSSSVSSESGYSSVGSDVYDATSFMHGTTGASADILHSYDFLEPLMPTAMLDSSGNIQPCSPVPAPVPVMAKTLSLFDHVTLLSSSASPSSEYDCFGPISAPITHFSRSQSNLPPACFDSSTQSSSRASSPDNSNDAFALSGPSFSQAPLSVDSDDELDTKDIAERVSNELRRFNISQLLFAQVVLGRSQGTLSDLLRNPKPWDKLKSGRETFARMQQWLQEPEKKRLAALKRAGIKFDAPEMESPVPEKPVASISCKPRPPVPTNSEPKHKTAPFTEEQRQIMQKVFEQNHHPDRNTQMALSVELDLPLSLVANYFLNARRRLRYSYQRGGGSGVLPGAVRRN